MLFKNVLRKLLDSPKTYYPLVTGICLWALEPLGVDVTPEIRDSLTVILMMIAGILLRRGMVKEKDTAKLEAAYQATQKEISALRTEIRLGSISDMPCYDNDVDDLADPNKEPKLP